MMTNPSILRAGSRGAEVTALQARLVRAGATLDVSGLYDDATVAAVRTYQRGRGLVADGIAGARTQAALIGQFDPRALTQADIDIAADQLDCEPAAVQAVVEVESPDTGFLWDGRLRILFERHVFWQRLVERGVDPATLSASPTILSPQPGGYVGGAGEYARLAQARAISIDDAMESCSFGRFQIMGYHAPALGYLDASAMAQAFAIGEREQIGAFGKFIVLDADLHKALRNRKWAAFAKIYNGPAYADNLYDARLARAYARHAAAQQAAA